MPRLAALSAINRLVDPRSERGIYSWVPSTALPELLDFRCARLFLNQLYRCLSLVEPHKKTIEKHLAEQARDLFHCQNDLLLYDLTSTYFEGRLAHNPKAQRGYSRDHRPDCKQRCLGLVVNRDGFPLGYESLPGNRQDATTLLPLIKTLEDRFGSCPRIICFDRGMATEANLRELRRSKRSYLCGSRRAVVRQHLAVIRSGPWTTIRSSASQQPTIEVHELPSTTATNEPTKRWLLCRSAGCRLKEQQMYDARLSKARQRLAKLTQQGAIGTFTTPAVILAKAKKAVGRTHDLQGVYLLRTTVPELPADDLWKMYMLLTRVEAAFRNRKTDLCIRPIYHRKENRGDAHVLFSVLAYALSVTIQLRCQTHGTAGTTPALLEMLQSVQLAELSYQTSDGNRLGFERASVPSAA